jgi:hypothetical protein
MVPDPQIHKESSMENGCANKDTERKVDGLVDGLWMMSYELWIIDINP